MNKSVLVTGGTGFVGANIVRRCLDNGCRVHLAVREQSVYWRLRDILSDVEIHTLNMSDSNQVEKLLKSARPDWVYHLAAYGAYPYRFGMPYQQNIGKMIDTNIRSTVELVRASSLVSVEAFVNAGSSSEYGLKDHPMSEEDVLNPVDNYGATKVGGALLGRTTAQALGVPFYHLRLFSVYGPYEEPARLIPTAILGQLNRTGSQLANPNSVRDFIHIDDVIAAFSHITTPHVQPGIYNVGSGVQHSVGDCVRLIQEVSGDCYPVEWGQIRTRPNEPKAWVADNSKLVQTGWNPKHTLKTGLESTFRWFFEHLALYNDGRER